VEYKSTFEKYWGSVVKYRLSKKEGTLSFPQFIVVFFFSEILERNI
jgi:hypothetical protein